MKTALEISKRIDKGKFKDYYLNKLEVKTNAFDRMFSITGTDGEKRAVEQLKEKVKQREEYLDKHTNLFIFRSEDEMVECLKEVRSSEFELEENAIVHSKSKLKIADVLLAEEVEPKKAIEDYSTILIFGEKFISFKIKQIEKLYFLSRRKATLCKVMFLREM